MILLIEFLIFLLGTIIVSYISERYLELKAFKDNKLNIDNLKKSRKTLNYKTSISLPF